MTSVAEPLKRKPGPWLQTALVLLLLTVLTILMTWPIAGRLGTHIPASEGDAWVHFWTFNWLKNSLSAGQSPYFTDLLFYPAGATLYFHNIAWLNFALWLPLQALFGAAAAYSLVYLAVIVFNGFAGYLLARDITSSSLAGFVGGLVVAFWPYALSHHNHPNLVFIAWIPLTLLYLKRFFDRGRRRDILLSALFIALIGITRWQLLIMSGFLIGFYILYRLITDNQLRTRQKLGQLAIIAVLALLIMLPLLLPVVSKQLTRDDPNSLFVDEEFPKTDLAAYFVPNRYHPLWGETAFQLYENFSVNKVLVPFIGYTTLILAIYGSISRWPHSRFWLLVALLYIILALGPVLTVNGTDLPLPMPYRLIEDFFLIKLIRTADRLNVILSIPVSVLVAFGVTSLLSHRTFQKWGVALATLVGFLILLEYIVTFPTFKLEVPKWYDNLASEPDQFGVLSVPMDMRGQSDKAYMYYQTKHGKPIVGGHVSRPGSETFDYIEDVPLLTNLQSKISQPPGPAVANIAEQMRLLSEANIQYLVLDKGFLSDADEASWKKWLIYDSLYEDERVAVYRTDPILGRDFALSHELLVDPDSRSQIGLISASTTPLETVQGSQIHITAEWASSYAVESEYDLCISLIDDRGRTGQKQCQSLAPTWPTSRWQADEMVSTAYSLELSPFLESGTYSVNLSLADGDTLDPTGRRATIAHLDHDTFPRNFIRPDPAFETQVTWNDTIRLGGYDLVMPDDAEGSLAVTFYWQALERIDDSYTNFLHLIDPVSGQIVAQADVKPRDWTYPTDWWEQDEWVDDTVMIFLEDVPPGEYDLFVGWYNFDTGERLSAYSESGEPFAGDSVPLISVER